MYERKNYEQININFTQDELKLILDSLKYRRKRENPKSIKAIKLLNLVEKIENNNFL